MGGKGVHCSAPVSVAQTRATASHNVLESGLVVMAGVDEGHNAKGRNCVAERIEIVGPLKSDFILVMPGRVPVREVAR